MKRNEANDISTPLTVEQVNAVQEKKRVASDARSQRRRKKKKILSTECVEGAVSTSVL